MEELHKKWNTVIAGAVFIIACGIFLMTVAPTVAFWDCGEYVGAGHTLAVPHPPGNPLYIILARVFSMAFFFFRQVAFRINLISVYSSAFTAMFLYLIIVRVMVAWTGIPDSTWKRLTVYLAGFSGGLFGVFGTTFWSSAVEAEVIAPSMLVVVICTWLALAWAQSTDPRRDRLLVLFCYLSFLGIGLHMFTMMALIPIFPFVMLVDKSKARDWRLWLCAVLMGTVIYHVSSFLWVGPALLALTAVMISVSEKAKAQWRFCFFIVLFALLGYSVHIFIPIRSALKPIIDENHPVIEMKDGRVEWDAFRGFLERKQYGSESMVTRMFWRRGSWTKQLGIDGHMGFGGFHLTQFFHFGKSSSTDRDTPIFDNWGAAKGTVFLLAYLIPTLFMLYGWYYLYRRSRNEAALLIFSVVLSTLGLVLYMNFADGDHAEKRDYQMWVRSGRPGPMPTVHREVRVRDYFFTPGFMFFGLWIGVAAGCALHAMYTSKNGFIRSNVAPIASMLFAVSPLLPIMQNYKENDRSSDWVPYDYAYNLLMSCKKDGILITNGDNDTFPLWFLQEAEGIRRDVRIVNLSLLNTKWYIKQLKELEPKVPIRFTDAQIDALNHELNPIAEPIPYTFPAAGITVQLPGRKELNALRVQDKMVVHMVDVNKWNKPIYFAVTVSNDNMMGLQPYLQMQGLAYEILPERLVADRRVDLDRTAFLLDRVFRFRGLGTSTEPMNETTQKLLSNYAAAFIQVALVLRNPLMDLKREIEDLEKVLYDTTGGSPRTEPEGTPAILASKRAEYDEKFNLVNTKLDQCIALMPWDWRPRALRQEILMSHGRYDTALEKIREARQIEPDNVEYLKIEAQILDRLGKRAETNRILRQLAEHEKDSWNSYAYMCTNYEEMGMWDSAIDIMEQYRQMHPGDRRADAMISRLNNLKKAAAAVPAESSAQAVPAAVAPGTG